MSSGFKLTSADDYVVRLDIGENEKFSGPLDLLLHLIEREELPITSVSLVQVTGQYLEYLSRLEELQPDGIAEFLTMAARLLYIKSQALLPPPEQEDEDEEEEDPAEALARQLREYKLFKEAAARLQDIEATGRRGYIRLAAPPKLEKRLDPTGLTVQALLNAVYEALRDWESVPAPSDTIEPHAITVREKMADLRSELKRFRTVRFRQFLGQARSRVEIIVSFMAVLEMIKQREVRVAQATAFGDIVIEPLPPAEKSSAPEEE
ncbi:MAG: segregation/condensation protein A [Caldilineales bacterium]|nr:segregation/condensation protein A [Caldilineales bacterium]